MTDVDEYQIAAGWNNEGGLTSLNPQPACPGWEDARIIRGGDGLNVEDGCAPSSFDYGFTTHAQYASLLTQCGLSDSVKSAKVTIRIKRNSDRSFENHNAIIDRPSPKNVGGKYPNVRFLLLVYPTPL